MPTSNEIFDDTFLLTRSKLLDIAANLDRIDRATADGLTAQKRDRIDEAIQILLSDGDDRAKRIQLLFSRPYQASWRADAKLK